MKIFFRWLLCILGGVIGLPCIGYFITELAVPDYPKQFSEDNKFLVHDALQTTKAFLDNPIERVLIQKYQIVSLKFKYSTKRKKGTKNDSLDHKKNGPRILYNVIPKGFPVNLLHSKYTVKIRAYTLFAIPVTTVSVNGEGPYAGSCKRLQ